MGIAKISECLASKYMVDCEWIIVTFEAVRWEESVDEVRVGKLGMSYS